MKNILKTILLAAVLFYTFRVIFISALAEDVASRKITETEQLAGIWDFDHDMQGWPALVFIGNDKDRTLIEILRSKFTRKTAQITFSTARPEICTAKHVTVIMENGHIYQQKPTGPCGPYYDITGREFETRKSDSKQINKEITDKIFPAAYIIDGKEFKISSKLDDKNKDEFMNEMINYKSP